MHGSTILCDMGDFNRAGTLPSLCEVKYEVELQIPDSRSNEFQPCPYRYSTSALGLGLGLFENFHQEKFMKLRHCDTRNPDSKSFPVVNGSTPDICRHGAHSRAYTLPPPCIAYSERELPNVTTRAKTATCKPNQPHTRSTSVRTSRSRCCSRAREDCIKWIPSLNTWLADKQNGNPVPYMSFVNQASMNDRGFHIGGEDHLRREHTIIPCQRFYSRREKTEDASKHTFLRKGQSAHPRMLRDGPRPSGDGRSPYAMSAKSSPSKGKFDRPKYVPRRHTPPPAAPPSPPAPNDPPIETTVHILKEHNQRNRNVVEKSDTSKKQVTKKRLETSASENTVPTRKSKDQEARRWTKPQDLTPWSPPPPADTKKSPKKQKQTVKEEPDMSWSNTGENTAEDYLKTLVSSKRSAHSGQVGGVPHYRQPSRLGSPEMTQSPDVSFPAIDSYTGALVETRLPYDGSGKEKAPVEKPPDTSAEVVDDSQSVEDVGFKSPKKRRPKKEVKERKTRPSKIGVDNNSTDLELDVRFDDEPSTEVEEDAKRPVEKRVRWKAQPKRREAVVSPDIPEKPTLTRRKTEDWIYGDEDFSTPLPLDVEEEERDVKSFKIPSPPRVQSPVDSPSPKKMMTPPAVPIGLPEWAQKRWGDRNVDSSYQDELRRQRLAEERRRKALLIHDKLKNRKHMDGGDADLEGGPRFDDYGWLAKYCIFNRGILEMYKMAFETIDESKRGWLSPLDTILGLRAVCHSLTDSEEEYLFRLLEMTGYKITDGADFKLFAIIAALAQKIAALDDWMKNIIGKMDMKMLDMKMFMCKELWECNVDPETNKISIDQLCVELRAGGVSYEHECEVREKLGHLEALDLLDFMTYIPLFIMIHESVVDNPLDQSRLK